MHSPHNGLWHRAFVLPFGLCLNKPLSKNGDARYLRRHHAHYDAIVTCLTATSTLMTCCIALTPQWHLINWHCLDINAIVGDLSHKDGYRAVHKSYTDIFYLLQHSETWYNVGTLRKTHKAWTRGPEQWTDEFTCITTGKMIDDVIKWKHFLRYWPLWGEFNGLSLDAFINMRLNKQLGKQLRRRLFETPSHPLWHHSNVV